MTDSVFLPNNQFYLNNYYELMYLNILMGSNYSYYHFWSSDCLIFRQKEPLQYDFWESLNSLNRIGYLGGKQSQSSWEVINKEESSTYIVFSIYPWEPTKRMIEIIPL